MILTRTPLRISFVGGGTDIPSFYEEGYGAVVSVTIDKYIYITSKINNLGLFPHKYRLAYSRLEKTKSASDIKHKIIKEVLEGWDYRIRNPGIDLDVVSDIPSGTGLGSSSAFTVGLLQNINQLNKDFFYYAKHDLAHDACDIELNKLNEPIGKQDQYAAAFGGLNYMSFMKKGVDVQPILLNPAKLSEFKDSLHLIYLGGKRSASELLKEQMSKDQTKILSAMVNVAVDAQGLLRRGEVQYFGDCVKRGWELKKQLSPNVSTPKADLIIETALKNGATGGKILGAGGAGFILLFCPENNKDKMFNALKRFKPKVIPFNFDTEGSKVLYEG